MRPLFSSNHLRRHLIPHPIFTDPSKEGLINYEPQTVHKCSRESLASITKILLYD